MNPLHLTGIRDKDSLMELIESFTLFCLQFAGILNAVG
jgi:hypothetical protein